ncbi:ATP phosphoribosyltransferase regulatory subunit [Lachnospiraceae bacterium ZAX-1]
MEQKRLHTPEGVRDIYNDECAKKMLLQENLQKLLKQYGYHAIQTPTFEYFDIFSQEIGTTPSKDLYKFFDREGNTLVLRPDITPSIARSVTKYYADENMPIRLWYQGNTFINNDSYQGRLKESTHLGAELIGDSCVDADGEILALVVDALKTAGLKEFQISVGHVDYFKGLILAAELDEDTINELIALISNKNFFGVQEVIDKQDIPIELKKMFTSLGVLYDSGSMLNEVKELSANYPMIYHSVKRLEQLYEVLACYGIEKYVSIELGMLSSYHYYTGIIFAGYTFGSGEPIVKGGRYDDLLPYFGKNAASIGFVVVVDQLMAALSRQKIDIPLEAAGHMVVYQRKMRSNAIALAQKLRANGEETTLYQWEGTKAKEQYEQYASRMHVTNITFLED